MTLQQMKYALTIAEQGSMNKAAEQLFISQPSLTSAVRELEKEIGIQVFVRSSRGVSVTAERRRKAEIRSFHAALFLCGKGVR